MFHFYNFDICIKILGISSSFKKSAVTDVTGITGHVRDMAILTLLYDLKCLKFGIMSVLVSNFALCDLLESLSTQKTEFLNGFLH